jgi:hypothetical protein
MFFLKKLKASRQRKEAATQERRESERAENLASAGRFLELVRETKDPVEKIEQLVKTKQLVQDIINRTDYEIGRDAEEKGQRAAFKAVLAPFAAGAAVLAGVILTGATGGIASALVLLSVVVAGGVGAIYGVTKQEAAKNATQKSLKQKSQGFYDQLDGLKKSIDTSITETLRIDTTKIARSSKRSKVFELPGVREAFLNVSVDKLASGDDQPAAATTPKAAVSSRPAV